MIYRQKCETVQWVAHHKRVNGLAFNLFKCDKLGPRVVDLLGFLCRTRSVDDSLALGVET